ICGDRRRGGSDGGVQRRDPGVELRDLELEMELAGDRVPRGVAVADDDIVAIHADAPRGEVAIGRELCLETSEGAQHTQVWHTRLDQAARRAEERQILQGETV